MTDKVIEEMNDWAVRPLEPVYAAIGVSLARGARHPRAVGRQRQRGRLPAKPAATSTSAHHRRSADHSATRLGPTGYHRMVAVNY
jgi:hypothetical protein